MDLGLDLEVIYKEGAGTTYFCNIDEILILVVSVQQELKMTQQRLRLL